MRKQDTPRRQSRQAQEIISRIEAIGGKWLMPTWGKFQLANWQACPEQLFLEIGQYRAEILAELQVRALLTAEPDASEIVQ